jgi:hypothetical protein
MRCFTQLGVSFRYVWYNGLEVYAEDGSSSENLRGSIIGNQFFTSKILSTKPEARNSMRINHSNHAILCQQSQTFSRRNLPPFRPNIIQNLLGHLESIHTGRDTAVDANLNKCLPDLGFGNPVVDSATNMAA